MNIIHLATSNIGGAGKAVNRLNESLNKNRNITSKVLTVNKRGDNPNIINLADTKVKKGLVKARSLLNNIPLKFYDKESPSFSTNKFGLNVTKYDMLNDFDIINLHWINSGFLSLKNIYQIEDLKTPIFWILRDMWPFTGGCHYSGNCKKYINKCGKCPVLNSNKKKDLSRKIWKKKRYYFEKTDIKIIALSNWISNCAKKSSLFKNYPIEVIPNPIDTNVYKPIERDLAREIINIKTDKTIILFGAVNATSDKRKGFKYLKESLKVLESKYNFTNKDVELLVFGSSYSSEIEDLPYKSHFVGHLYDDFSISLCYNAADVFVAPSIEDNLPKTPMEALSCGVPVVAFNVGGIPDMIDHNENGYLAKYKSNEDLAYGIQWVLENEKRYQKLRKNARKKVLNNYTYDIIGEKYLNIYTKYLK